jgi:hypothetical protein
MPDYLNPHCPYCQKRFIQPGLVIEHFYQRHWNGNQGALVLVSLDTDGRVFKNSNSVTPIDIHDQRGSSPKSMAAVLT